MSDTDKLARQLAQFKVEIRKDMNKLRKTCLEVVVGSRVKQDRAHMEQLQLTQLMETVRRLVVDLIEERDIGRKRVEDLRSVEAGLLEIRKRLGMDADADKETK